MLKSKSKNLIAVIQTCSSSNVEANFGKLSSQIKECASNGASLVCLPECFAFMGTGSKTVFKENVQNGEVIGKYKSLAAQLDVNLSLGGFSEECADNVEKRYNSHLLISEKGQILANYRKTHLYDVDLAKTGGVSIFESKYIEQGPEMVKPVALGGFNLGLTICYDLRFPEIFRILALQGANVILVPSAFMVKTGQAHWETLLKARAIENQCYIIAAAQCGTHNSDESEKPR